METNNKPKKMTLQKRTLQTLNEETLDRVNGGYPPLTDTDQYCPAAPNPRR
ncbi:MAG TPA: class I lanthipeptide [Polyangiaceae bacterium]|nr:class I lanthipeptide [Polyangiaceae bacterium]